MTQHAELFAALMAPFRAEEVKSRQQAGRTLHYVTARTCMNRLDEVLGPENWRDEYTLLTENSVLCRLTIRIPDPDAAEGRGWIELSKCDAGGAAGMTDSGDDDKSMLSDAFKRACVKFGVSRYLYRDGVPDFARHLHDREPGEHSPGPGRREGARPAQAGGNIPRTGRALFAWVKDLDGKQEVGLLRYMDNFGKANGFPGRMVDWGPDAVASAYGEAVRKIREVNGHAEGEGLHKQYSEAG